MWEYTDRVMELFYNPRNQGTLTATDAGEAVAIGEVGSIACGDALRLYLRLDRTTEIILDARFQTFGCASAIASSSALTELIKGKTLDAALALTNREIAEYLGGLPEEKMHCSVMGQEALEAAIFNYRGIPLDNHDDDEGAIVCRCFGVTDTRLRRVIRENKLETVEQVTNYVKAGGGCSSCLVDIEDLIFEVTQEVKREKETSVAVATQLAEGKPLTNLQKITLIQQVLESEIKPVLAADGGDVELYDVAGDRVQVILKGACHGCGSSADTLKMAIEARLRDRVSPTLTVEAV